jgi:exportin-1
MGLTSENLFDFNMSNKDSVMNFILNLLKGAYAHLNTIQIETFCIALFNKCYNFHEFKYLIRDFLVLLKSFSGTNEDIFEEEKKVFLYANYN